MMSDTFPVHSLRIRREEFNGRCHHLLTHIQTQNLTGAVIYDSINILYFTGFAFIPTERPIVFVMNADGEKGMFVPRLEVEPIAPCSTTGSSERSP
jgi:Xaa-Pro aminopeptidase